MTTLGTISTLSGYLIVAITRSSNLILSMSRLLCSALTSVFCFFFFSSRRRHTRSLCDWSSDVCSSDLSSTPRPSHRLCPPVRAAHHRRSAALVHFLMEAWASPRAVVVCADGHDRRLHGTEMVRVDRP